MKKIVDPKKSAAARKGVETRLKNKYLETANQDSLRMANTVAGVNISDGWANLLTGMGLSGYDKKVSTFFMGDTKLGQAEIRDILVFNGLGKRIVNLMAETMLRKWFTIEGDTDNLVPNYIRNIKGRDNGTGKREIYRALKWARAYGGSLIVLGAMDGQDLTRPLNENGISKIEFMHAYHRYCVSRSQYYLDPTQPNYYETEIYIVNPPRGAGFPVHESRVLIFDGEECPPETRLQNYGWGESVLQAVFTRLRGLGESYAGCEHIIQEFVMNVLKMKGLANLIASGQESQVRTRLNLFDLSKHINNTALIDENEEITRMSASISGLPDLMGKLIQATASETGYPVRMLFGETNVGSGLSNDRTEETQDYYDVVASEQEEKLRGPFERLSKLIMLSKEGPTNGAEIKSDKAKDGSWNLVFAPLRVQSQKEMIEDRKAQAEVDKAYIDGYVLDPEEIRKSRFGGNSYSFETTIDKNLNPKDDKTPEPVVVVDKSGNPIPKDPAADPNALPPDKTIKNPEDGGNFKYCICKKCGYTEDHIAGTPCSNKKCPECGTELTGSNEKGNIK
jgi:phage-related protein (TIGR01555 family)